eukprot:TRINITY_DN26216_c0_g1_i1.p1 TRINITY_DN26216_c0_g1~~TRINITY_DN26216_c0_g1_i1.p1  ORF type:complete len:163 (+),score=24.32 TRINITY_DN26216_c0_g1_i1:218-706(+)
MALSATMPTSLPSSSSGGRALHASGSMPVKMSMTLERPTSGRPRRLGGDDDADGTMSCPMSTWRPASKDPPARQLSCEMMTGSESSLVPVKNRMLVDKVMATFDSFDINHDGAIDRNEMRYLLQALDKKLWTDSMVDDIFKSIDVNGDGKLQFEEFLSWVFG